ncbi:MAG TPA: hypothetical protein VKF82_07780, partial [Candidatus Eremiobacteraceae bacterium]|nr:hypothetical protein [Candidatus Eremiobacteraceae bacterium]
MAALLAAAVAAGPSALPGGVPGVTPAPAASTLPGVSPAPPTRSTATPSAAPTVAPTPTPLPTPTPTPAPPADVAIVWHMAASTSADASVRAAAISLTAPDSIGAIERALRAHPRTHFSLAIDAGALDGLARAASGDSALQTMAQGHLIGGARADMLRLLAQVPVLDDSLTMLPTARRYRALAAAAPLALAGQRAAAFSASDYVEFAGFGALVRLAAAGELPANSPLLQKNALTDA